MMRTNKNDAPRKALGLYLHIPFCIRKCNYCDFLSFSGIPQDEQKAYFRSLLHEMKVYHEIYSNKYYVDSIFIGGGTPSLADEGLIRELLTAVRDDFTVAPDVEISIETNPKTLTKNKLNTYMEAGINRLSIGAQSFDDELLSTLGRAHSTADFFMNYSLARECGFRNINIDLMFAIPGQTMKTWIDTLEKAIGLEPEHISFYSLQLEEGTPFFSMSEEGSLKMVEDELDRDMYHGGVKLLKNTGYQHYEISNAAKEGYSCRHNLKYWSMEDYLGLGLGAHSFMDGIRFSNGTDLKGYGNIGHVDAFPTRDSFMQWEHRNTEEESISEYLFTGLRKIRGIDLADFSKRFGADLESVYGETLDKHLRSGLIQIESGRLRFTKKGIDLSNTVLADFV
ncbi:MAG: radical SAM family heme chaperone HemW [Eubacteriales bacterium]|nr:radical SAM family heme chaperone HemW [Eubacteriales bacterium]